MRHDMTATLNSPTMNNPYNSMQNAYPPAPPEDQPLTAEVMTRIDLALEAASRAQSNLYDLRNRLFGCPPECADARNAKGGASGFKEAFRERAEGLSDMLLSIERLASELANRL